MLVCCVEGLMVLFQAIHKRKIAIVLGQNKTAEAISLLNAFLQTYAHIIRISEASITRASRSLALVHSFTPI